MQYIYYVLLLMVIFILEKKNQLILKCLLVAIIKKIDTMAAYDESF